VSLRDTLLDLFCKAWEGLVNDDDSVSTALVLVAGFCGTGFDGATAARCIDRARLVSSQLRPVPR
jgi:hypothetical protein